MHTDDPIYAQYYVDVSRTRMPESVEEERQLFRRYHEQGDPVARNKIVEGGLRFVIKTAKQYYRGDMDFLKTLIAAGNVGLLVAVDRYMPWVIRCLRCHKQTYVKTAEGQNCPRCGRRLRSKDAERYTTRFLTYAAWWILEAIRTELYENNPVHVPPYKQKEQHRAKQNGIPQHSFTYISLDDHPDEIVINHEDSLINGQARKILQSVLSTMNDRQAYVLITYYGLREEPKTLREIAQKLGVCPERVRQIKLQAMRELRHRLQTRKISCVDDCAN